MIVEQVLTFMGILYALLLLPGVGIVLGIALQATKLARLGRVLRGMPSVVTLMLGIYSALTSAFATFLILFVWLIGIAVIFRTRFGGPVYTDDGILMKTLNKT